VHCTMEFRLSDCTAASRASATECVDNAPQLLSKIKEDVCTAVAPFGSAFWPTFAGMLFTLLHIGLDRGENTSLTSFRAVRQEQLGKVGSGAAGTGLSRRAGGAEGIYIESQ
jgi:hypothetical protein